MTKIDYAVVSAKLSELFYKQINLEQSLIRDADDRIDDMYGRASSVKATFAAEDWFEGEKARVLEESGWTLEEYSAAEEEETRAFYADLEKPSEDSPPAANIIHDYGDEDEAELEALLEELDECSSCQRLNLRGANCEDCRSEQTQPEL